MRLPARALLLLAVASLLAGCSANGATASNFTLEPQRVGWYAGEEAHFVLALTPSLTRSEPSFTIDRHFAIEEIRFKEQGIAFGGNFKTRDPDAVALRLMQNNVTGDEFVLDADNPTVDVFLTLPSELRDSEYTFELSLFKVGWVKSESFRVDRRD